MPAFIGLVEIDKVAIAALRPTAGRLVDLAGEDGHCGRDRDVDGVEVVRNVLPVETRRRGCRIRKPIERDVVESVSASFGTLKANGRIDLSSANRALAE